MIDSVLTVMPKDKRISVFSQLKCNTLKDFVNTFARHPFVFLRRALVDMVVLVFRERVLGDKRMSDRELLNHAGLSDVTDALLDDDLDTEPAAAATAAAETAPASTVAPAPTDANAVPSAASSGAADAEDAELAAALQKLPETILFLASTLLPGKVLTLESAGGALCVFFTQFSQRPTTLRANPITRRKQMVPSTPATQLFCSHSLL